MWSRLQLWLGAILPVVFTFVGLASTQWLQFGALYAVAMVLADELLEVLIDRARARAATAQQMFDCTLYGWQLRSGTRRLEASEVEKWASKGRQDGIPLNWYPNSIANAPLTLARVICQQSNMWWDSALRLRYVALMAIAVGGLALVVAARAYQLDWTIGVTALALVNVLPVVQWCVRNAIRQVSMHNVTREQSERAEALRNALIQRRIAEADAEEESRALQDDIFERRRTSPVGVSWIYKRSRAEFDSGMKANAAETIREYLACKDS